MSSMFPLADWQKLSGSHVLPPEIIKTIEQASGMKPTHSSLPNGVSVTPTDIASPVSSDQKSKSTNFLKRTQVPRACTNCRKMHAACGLERPCKRCTQAGLESSCQDIPRKKRTSKKKSRHSSDSEEEEEIPHSTQVSQTTPTIQQTTPQPQAQQFFNFQQTPSYTPSQQQYSPAPQSKMWEETYADLFGAAKENNFSSFLGSNFTSTTSKKEKQSMVFQPDPLILSELSDDERKPSSSSYSHVLPSMTTTQVEAFVPKSSSWAKSEQKSSQASVTMLLQQIYELRENNVQLEKKLNFVTNELTELKMKTPMRSGWVTLTPQSELAISVWKSMTSTQGTQNVLVECNERFVEIMGYSIEILRNNFPCSKMIRRKDLLPSDDDGARLEWPKKTQIVTARGMRDVFIIIYPVLDADSVIQYFVVHLMDVSK